MRLVKIAVLIVNGVFLMASVPAFASSIDYSSYGNGFTALSQPTTAYLNSTYLYSLTGPDYSVTNTVSNWKGAISFSTGLTELSVPSSWPSWNCPAMTESCTPRVLATPGDTLGINLEYGYPDAKTFGFELQPQTQGVDEIVVNFFNDNTLLGTIDQFVSGNGGAQFFGAIRTSYFWINGQRNGDMPFTDVQITDLSGNSFAIANLRAAPEPSGSIMLGSGLLALVFGVRRKLPI